MNLPLPGALRLGLTLFTIGWVCLTRLLSAAEPWADSRLTVTNGLELWLDAARQNPGRGPERLPTLASGQTVDYLLDASGHRRHLVQPRPEFRPRFIQSFNGAFLGFDGTNDALVASRLGQSFPQLTAFVVANPVRNRGEFRGLFAFSQAGRNDYVSGLNLDLGPLGTPRLTFLNVEGAGLSGAANLLGDASFDFGQWHILALATAENPPRLDAFIDGRKSGSRPRPPASFQLHEVALGARHYSNSPEAPFTQGFFEGHIAELLVFSRSLSPDDRSAVEKYLSAKYAQLLALPPTVATGSQPLTPVTNPPPIQMLVPGFTARELPVSLKNVNNVKYRADGVLVASGYNGHVHLLRDTDGDGLEDRAEPFWTNDSVHAPVGLALTPRGYSRGNGVFLPGKGKVSLIVDTNRDDRADLEIVVATWTEKSEQQGVDALGVAVGPDESLYFGLGAASYVGAYQVDKATGESRYRLTSERGTILKVSPDFKTREIVCTGIRFSVGMAFNHLGDLFVTDQEGATWLPNGNPFDELLHIQPGRHYGFPPRHPKHLPNVIDEPSVFDYTPQHQSTCGLSFNDPVNGGPPFGPPGWAGDALVAGYSRGKLWRTRLARTPEGYIAQSQLLACLQSLTVDACPSPRGDLIVATHSGNPDWGSGPNGVGKLWRLRQTDRETPQPIALWNASPTELRVHFDRPLTLDAVRDLPRRTQLESGRYVAAGDRFETVRPGYQVVYDQLSAPRESHAILSTSLSPDRRTLSLLTRPRVAAVPYALTLPRLGGSQEARPHDQIDLLSDLTGLDAEWLQGNTSQRWHGWLPHADMTANREFLSGSSEHAVVLHQPGRLTLRGQLDLSSLLHPAVQPGASLDYQPAGETVTVEFSSTGEVESLVVNGHPVARESRDGRSRARFSHGNATAPWVTFELRLKTDQGAPDLRATWFTADSATPRPFPIRRFLLPWAQREGASPAVAPAERVLPELAGGQWLRGRQLFFSESLACSKCHSMRGAGGHVGPELSNLVHRDYASVLRDIREPGAAINPDHVAFEVERAGADSLTAVLLANGAEELTFASATGQEIHVPRREVVSIKPSAVSLMPEGLLQSLTADQVRDLMTFLLTSPLDAAPIEVTGPAPPPPRRLGDLPQPIFPATHTAARKMPLRVLLSSGPKDHGPGEHDYPLWRKRWSKLLGLAEGLEVNTVEGWPTKEQWQAADVILFYSNNPGWSAAQSAQLDAFLERGGGAVYIHWAVDGHQDSDALAERIGLAWRGGQSKFRHGPLSLKFHPHPIIDGLAPLDLVDESYWQLVGDEKRIQLAASAVEEGREQPLLWTRTQGRGRVFVSIPGHYTWTFDDPLFRRILLRGLCWAAQQPLDRLSDLETIGARIRE